MYTDPRYIQLVVLEVRMFELKELIKAINHRLVDVQSEYDTLSSQIENCKNNNK